MERVNDGGSTVRPQERTVCSRVGRTVGIGQSVVVLRVDPFGGFEWTELGGVAAEFGNEGSTFQVIYGISTCMDQAPQIRHWSRAILRTSWLTSLGGPKREAPRGANESQYMKTQRTFVLSRKPGGSLPIVLTRLVGWPTGWPEGQHLNIVEAC